MPPEFLALLTSGDTSSVALDPNTGKIVIAGSATLVTTTTVKGRTTTTYDPEFAVLRYNTNGTLDTSFNGTGIFTKNFVQGLSDPAIGVVVQSDGKILAGTLFLTADNLTRTSALVRITTSGSLDASWGSGGVAKLVRPGTSIQYDSLTSLVIQPDGKVVSGGGFSDYRQGMDSSGNNVENWGLARFNTNGSLDTNFGTGGIVSTSLGTDNLGTARYGFIRASALQADGKLVVFGDDYSNYSTPSTYVGLARYNTDGSLDSTFGTGGFSLTTRYSGMGNHTLLALSDGNLMVAGLYTYPGTSALVRYTSSGTIDPTYGTNGIVTFSFNGGGQVTGLALSPPDGKIVVGGKNTIQGSLVNYYAARFLGDPPPTSLQAVRSSGPAAMIAPDPTLVPLVLGEANFFDSLAAGKRRKGVSASS